MPIQKNKRIFRRRRYVGKRRFYNRRRRFLRNIVPYSRMVKMPYQEDFTLTATAGALTVNVFSLNGLYDPNITGTGHQPRGFDQLIGVSDGSALYHHYVCVGAKVSFRVSNASSSQEVRFGLAVRDTSTAPSTANDYLEASNSISNVVPTNADSNTRVVTLKWSAKKWFGKSNVTDEKDLQGSSTANPIEQAYVHCWIDGNGAVANNPGTRCSVKIEYICVLQNPLVPGQS